jgi:ABC-type phosphate/phosphonate transport system substrate-binding protein
MVQHVFADAPPAKGTLRIGATPSINTGGGEKKEKLAAELLEKFIREETRMNNEISTLKDWRELAEKLAKGNLDLGVFQGYEFVWARDEHAGIKPLMLAVNVHRYAVVHVVVGKDCAAMQFADLKNQPLTLSSNSIGSVRKFVERKSSAHGDSPDQFFARIAVPATVEEALDDVAAGNAIATVVENAALEAYRRRKPGRAAKLRILESTDAVLPGIIAYGEGKLDRTALKQFRDGLVGAHAKERGKTLLTLFRLTGFDLPPDDFEKAVESTRKVFPPDKD